MNVRNLVKSIMRQFISYRKGKTENQEIDVAILKNFRVFITNKVKILTKKVNYTE